MLLSDDELDNLRRHASFHGLSVTRFVRALVLEDISRHGGRTTTLRDATKRELELKKFLGEGE